MSWGPYVTTDIIIEVAGGIVVIERTNPPFGWALPGGFVDNGESLEDAARREAKEETDLELAELKQFHTYSDPKRDPRFHTVTTVFTARGLGKPQAGDDAKGLIVVPFAELRGLTYAFDHARVIADYLDRR
ncbi:MAG: NUDIX hydrolase [Candidatus Omnitrophica bacterium]|nr:NUDIX hydrolase [Candidatus Omnitrophota bacterium]